MLRKHLRQTDLGKIEKLVNSDLPNPLYIQLDSSVLLELCLIPPGRFRMGSRYGGLWEHPVHWVEITRPFYMGRYPMLQSEWRALVDSYPSCDLNPIPSNFDGDRLPVEQVNWHDVMQWCDLLQGNALSSRIFDEGGNAVNLTDVSLGLPSEAQWEYACRAGTETEYHTGDGAAALAIAGWFDENSANKTHLVGEKLPNDFGLYDMHGNIREWCSNSWDENAYRIRVDNVQDPVVKLPKDGKVEENACRVIRGGSWDCSVRWCRASFRNRWRPRNRIWSLGFRVCLFLGPCPEEPVSTGAKSEPVPGDAVRREAETQSQRTGRDEAEVNLSESHFPSRKRRN
ncbi:formylglycine-generating enzyme family protein [Rubinisphaera sp.]|uniref:formylglycine-generating enzyme family protein n=1 Tax=Rubinisphaera sp. TaxID=2024857 RepID=UPI0034138D5B